jgi:DHA1 family multidrug resistance protein-like MFS transporter
MSDRTADPDPEIKPAPDVPAISWRRNLYALWIAQVLAIIGFTLRDSFLPFFLKDIGSDEIEQATLWAGLVQAGGAGVMAFAAPFWGMMADRRGRKPMVLRAMFAAMITISLMGFATAPWQLVALRMVEGAFTGTVAASTALVATTAPKEKLGYALGMIQTAVFAGASFGPFLGGLFADYLGFRSTFFVAGAFLGIAGFLVFFTVQERFTPAPRGEGRGLAGLRSASSWMFTPALITMIAVLFISRFAQMGVRPMTPLYIGQLGNLDDAHAASVTGLAFGLLGVTSALASVVLGRRGDRAGHEKILFLSVLGAGIIYLPMALITAPWQMVILQALFGIAAGGLIPAANAIVAARAPSERRGMMFGVTTSAASIGAFVGPLVCSAIAATAGFPVTFAFVGVVLVLLGVALGSKLATFRVPDPAETPQAAG